MVMRPVSGAMLALALCSQAATAFDTCIYVDTSGDVLRMNLESDVAEVTLSDDSVLRCTIAPATGAKAVRTGTCPDQPAMAFSVFTAASDPSFTEDDLLVFRNAVWYRKCAFTR